MSLQRPSDQDLIINSEIDFENHETQDEPDQPQIRRLEREPLDEDEMQEIVPPKQNENETYRPMTREERERYVFGEES